MINRAVIIVLDSAGIGELPDAAAFGDEGSNTIGNIVRHMGKIRINNLLSMGLGNIDGVDFLEKTDAPLGCFGRMAEKSHGKDTITGHWEISGIVLPKPFPTYPHGFPEEIINEFKKRTGTDILGNKAASGTEILNELGKEHMETGRPIVYTSADSVFQIACHTSIVPVEKLYEYCRIAREIMQGEHGVGRIIARPFIGEPGNFKRTYERRDFALKPIKKTILNFASDKGLKTVGIGPIHDVFSGEGLTEWTHTAGNTDVVDKTLSYINQDFKGIIFANLEDFDMLYGHRNNVEGYAKALEEFDARLPEITSSLHDDDILFITADHGNDPTTPSTDHSREYVPLLVYGKALKKGVNLGTRKTFADLGATVADILGTELPEDGTSFKKEILS